jgi:hypothetical protein
MTIQIGVHIIYMRLSEITQLFFLLFCSRPMLILRARGGCDALFHPCILALRARSRAPRLRGTAAPRLRGTAARARLRAVRARQKLYFAPRAQCSYFALAAIATPCSIPVFSRFPLVLALRDCAGRLHRACAAPRLRTAAQPRLRAARARQKPCFAPRAQCSYFALAAVATPCSIPVRSLFALVLALRARAGRLHP